MDLSTSFVGLRLSSPVIIGASPLADHAGSARELQDYGAGAIVMRSLFDEQIKLDDAAEATNARAVSEASAVDSAYFPALSEYQLSPKAYLRQIADLKAALNIPLIASLNGLRPGQWLDYARRMESAGADALELNLYHVSTDPNLSAADIEGRMLEAVLLVKALIRIPLAVKLSFFHTALVNFARGLERNGANGIVIFNRFYQPEMNIDDLADDPHLRLSGSSELFLRARWTSILASRLGCSLAITGGVHGASDIVKAVLAGADAVQMVSAVLKHGPRVLPTILDGVRKWMREHNYGSLAEFQGAMNLDRCPDASAFERGHYQRLLQTWHT